MGSAAKGTKERSGSAGGRRVKLKPHDSFDLIRLLARTQTDARKAVGELVQNSLDANARRVDVTWFNEKGERCLRVRDDGDGIFPIEDRPAALQRIAQTIGQSHKRSLSIAERREQMVLGKYGIGLLGFWCVARRMEISSRVGGGETWVLRLVEDEPEAEVARARSSRIGDEPTFTEITLRGVKDGIARQIRPPRLQAYLAGELRGQLLQRGVEVRIHDRIARGLATKEFVVKPRPYLGAPIQDIPSFEVPGHEDARVELYYVPPDEGRRGTVSLACGGTTVLDDLALVDLTDPEGGTRAPWDSGRFEGVIDFPELQVAPGTRRGFAPDEAALDFLLALEALEARLAERVARDEAERAEQRRENLAREIRRVFASVAKHLPQYDLFDVRAGDVRAGDDKAAAATDGRGGNGSSSKTPGERNGATAGEPLHPAEESGAAEAVVESEAEALEPDEPRLFPPGPFASVRIAPPRARIAPGTERRFRAIAADADGRRVERLPSFEWKLEGPGRLAASADEAVYVAPGEPGEARLTVVATEGSRSAAATARLEIRESIASTRAPGIPEPQAVHAPSEPWRSRIRGERWEFNEGHRDYLAVRDDDARRLRYLCHLFAKEVVLKNFGDPAHAELLERMVEILTHLGEGRAR
jgi:hypothetical protein